MNVDKSVSVILVFSLHCNHLPVGLVQTPDDVALYLYREGCELFPNYINQPFSGDVFVRVLEA